MRSDEIRTAALSMYADGYSSTAIHFALGFTNVLALAQKAGIKRTRKQAHQLRKPMYPEATVSAALSMYSDGFSCVEIADALGCGYNAVARWVQKEGIRRNLSDATRLAHKKLGHNGYVDVKGYRRFGNAWEHRTVMERALARPLHANERVHHKNGIRTDNRLSNLELWVVRVQPSGQRIQDRVQDALELLARYSGEFL